MSITDRTASRVHEIAQELIDADLRVETDLRNEKIGFKIREAQMEKIPYMFVLGDKEIETGSVAVRSRSGGDLGAQSVGEAVERIEREIAEKAIG
jgi:threonyl-tRNA synthetase